jgi:hypothetical protein
MIQLAPGLGTRPGPRQPAPVPNEHQVFTQVQLKEPGVHPIQRMRPDGYGDPHETNRIQRDD